MIRRNDWSELAATPLGRWNPTETVSVVVPAYGSQEKLDLALASISAQSYPEHLTEVIVVDDGDLSLQTPKWSPGNLRIIPTAEGRWGVAAAVDTGVRASTGSVVLRLDSDVIACHHHIEAHMRWHHQVGYAVVIGKLSFVDIEADEMSSEAVHSAIAANSGWSLFEGIDLDREWVSNVIRNRNELRKGDIQSFKVANGASVSFSRRLYDAAGGVATDLLLGEDTELSYRLSQQGAVYIPDKSAEAWHIGESQMRTAKEQGMRYRQPFFAGRVPLLHHHRKIHGVNWRVPMVEVVVNARDRSFEAIAATVGSILGGDRTDVAVTLLGSWPPAAADRYRPLEDPAQDARLALEAFGADQRVRFAESVEPTAAPIPYRLWLPGGVTLRHDALESALDMADKRQAGRINFSLSGQDEPVAVRLDRTAAVSRARWETGESECSDELVDKVWGLWWADGDELFGLADGTSIPWFRPSGVQRELARLRVAEEEQRKLAAKWKKSASDARASASRWEEAARDWERSAGEWRRAAEGTGRNRKAEKPKRTLRRTASGLRRRLKQALRR